MAVSVRSIKAVLETFSEDERSALVAITRDDGYHIHLARDRSEGSSGFVEDAMPTPIVEALGEDKIMAQPNSVVSMAKRYGIGLVRFYLPGRLI